MRARVTSSILCKTTVALSLLFAVAGGAQAQVIVNDPTQTQVINEHSLAAYARQGLQYAKEVQSALNTYNTYMSMLNKVQNVINNPIGALMPANTNMAHVDSSQVERMIQAKCGGSSGGSLSGMISSLVGRVNINGNIAQSQQQICAGIVTAQVDQYNATADLYNSMPQFHNSMNGLTSLINSISTLGESGYSSAQSNTFSIQQRQAITEWQARTDMDRRIIEALNGQQQVLGQISLRGSNTILGNVVQAGALKAAFDANK